MKILGYVVNQDGIKHTKVYDSASVTEDERVELKEHSTLWHQVWFCESYQDAQNQFGDSFQIDRSNVEYHYGY